MSRHADTIPLPPDHYMQRSQQPLQVLVFLLPLVIAYEIGALMVAVPETGLQVSARSFLRDFLEWFGAAGYYLPGLAVIAVLVVWHAVRGDRWRFQPALYGVMAMESAVMAMPMFVLVLMAMGQPRAMGYSWQSEMVFSVGAGVYEEMVFRLITIAVAHFVFVDLMKVNERRGAFAAIFVSALLFGLYHHPGGDYSIIQFMLTKRFWFCFIAGGYLAVIYVLRGFGIVAASHAIYDILIVLTAHQLWPW
ncbi:MAG: CPBP family intramembrane metalloprotease [Phycisphaera sp.]|nr:CPBP family intramembrane metalloprotease [Phycisphaera sp.]